MTESENIPSQLTPARVLERVAEYAEAAQRHDHAVDTAGDHSYEEGMWASEDALRDLDPALIRAHAKALAEREVEHERLRVAAREMMALLEGPRDAAYHELLPIVARNLRAALAPNQEDQ